MASQHLLEAAITDLESRRSVLGDAVVHAAVAALHAQIAAAVAAEVAAAVAVAPAPAARSPRLRQVSVLFVDIADSTVLLGRIGIEDVQDVMGTALERFAALVRDSGGEVLRFTGDGLKAAFGTQGVHEDEAERAVRAGLRILQAATEHAAVIRVRHAALRGWAFGVRVGVHTGPVLLGGGPELDHTAMGQAVHLAARMEQSAPVGRLRISQDTWALVRGLFLVEAQAPLRVKGHDKALRTWLVNGQAHNPERAADRGVLGVTPPMVGRDAEMQALQALWARCAAQRCSALALVLADAGVGKTRLRHELLQRLDAPALQARAHPSGMLQPYGLLRQLLARWLDIGDDLSADAACSRFVDGLLPWLGGSARPDATARAQRLGQLLGLDFSASAQVSALGGRELREQALHALADVLRALALQHPLLVVLDDVHWADDASLDAFEHLARPAAGAPALPVMWLWLARPALLERRAEPIPGEGVAHLKLQLSALPAAQAEALADALLAGVHAVPEALRQMLMARARGNPYFMEELLRRLIADGVIDTTTTPWQVRSDKLADLRVPETLVGLLQARLDAMPADELSALQQASIIGPVFWHTALAQLDERAPQVLPALQRRTAVDLHAHSSFAHDAEYGFQHPLLHEVTYGTVLKPMRLAGHAGAARWLSERMAGREGEFLALTAEHFERAGDAATAFGCYDRAQRDAMRRFAHGAALALIDRALALDFTPPPRHRFSLMTRRQTALDHLGRVPESRQQLQATADFAQAQDDDAMRADVATLRMLQADHEGRPDDARALAEAALALVKRHGGPTAMSAGALAHGEMAWLALQRHDFAEVQAQIDAGIACARVAATVPPQLGGYDGYEFQLRIIEIDAQMRQARYVASDAAVQQALQSLQDRQKSFALDRFHLLSLRCGICLHLGDLTLAQQLADEGVALAAQLEMPRMNAAALINVAEVALCSGDLAAVALAADEVERVAQTWSYPYLLPAVWRWRGDAAWERADWAAADDAWQRAAELFDAHQRGPDALQLRCRHAALRLRLGGPEATALAVQAVSAALAQADADGRPHHRLLEPNALLACHGVVTAAGDPRAASLRADLAARLAEQLDQLSDAAARHRLQQQVPHWRAVAQLLAAPTR